MKYKLPTPRKKELGKERILGFFSAPITQAYTAAEVAHHLHADPVQVTLLLDELVTSGDLETES